MASLSNALVPIFSALALQICATMVSFFFVSSGESNSGLYPFIDYILLFCLSLTPVLKFYSLGWITSEECLNHCMVPGVTLLGQSDFSGAGKMVLDDVLTT